MRILITGATGFIGRAVTDRLIGEKNEVTVLSRRPFEAQRLFPKAKLQAWDFSSPLSLPKVSVIIHLAGESIFGKRWTHRQKAIILKSRVESTRLIVNAIKKVREKPKVLLCASAIGYYGDRGDEELDEDSPGSRDFLADVCEQWERAAGEAEILGLRVVSTRIGMVLGKSGGALQKMLPPFKMGLGGPIGSGKQWMSWVHLDDLVGLILHAMHSPEIRDSLNVTAPHPCTNAEFARTLGKILRRPALLPTPVGALRLTMGEVVSVITSSQKVLPKVALKTGYMFRYPRLEKALRCILHGPC